MKRKDFFLTEKQIRKLQDGAAETGINVSEYLRRILDSYFYKVRAKDDKQSKKYLRKKSR